MVTVLVACIMGEAIIVKFCLYEFGNIKGIFLFLMISGLTLAGLIVVVLALIIFRRRIPFAMRVLKSALVAIKKDKIIFILNICITLIGCLINYVIAQTLYGIVSRYDNLDETHDTLIFTFHINIEESILILVVLFLYFYNNEVFKNLVHTVVSSVIYIQYYSKEYKTPVLTSMRYSITKSFGSICLGSLLVSTTRFLSALFKIVEGVLLLPMLLKNMIKKFFNIIPIVGSLIYFVIILTVFPVYLGIILIEYILKGIDVFMKYFNFYTFSYVAFEGGSYYESSKHTFDIMDKYKNNALINDLIIRFILFIGQYTIIFTGLMFTSFYLALLGMNEKNILMYSAGITLVFKKLFACITQSILSSTITIFVMLVDTGKIERFENKLAKNKRKSKDHAKTFTQKIKVLFLNFDVSEDLQDDMGDIFDLYTEMYGDPVDWIRDKYTNIIKNFLNETTQNFKKIV